MPRTPLMGMLRRVARDVDHEMRLSRAETPRGGQPALPRRAVLRGAAAAAAVGAVPLSALAKSEARVAVIGAGLAGLTAAYDLRQAGIRASVYEASTRLGGRCYSIRDTFAQGQIAEHGGEFIDTDHHAIRRLAKSLDLELDDVLAAQPKGSQALYFFDGQPYSVAQAAADYAHLYDTVQDQSNRLGDVDYKSSNAYAKALDRLTVADWVGLYVPGGRRSRLGRLIEDALSEENALDSDQLSAILPPQLFAPDPKDAFNLYYTSSDQRFHVRGGNDQIPNRLGALLGEAIQTGTVLTAITRRTDGRIRLSLRRDSHVFDRVYDRVILALPFRVMRDSVDYEDAGFKPLKMRAIRELRMGASVKFQLQFSHRVWRDAGCNGEIRRRSPAFQTTWEVTRAQPGREGVLNFWSGGSQALAAGSADAMDLAHRCLNDAETLIPGLKAAWTGRMTRDVWRKNPWSLGSYSAQSPGYATTVYGVEPEREGHCHFAGEHTAADYGYLNAAVTTGHRAAREVVKALA